MMTRLWGLCSLGFMLMIQRKEGQELLQGIRWPFMSSSIFLHRGLAMGSCLLTRAIQAVRFLLVPQDRGSSLERNMVFPSCVSPSTSTNLAEKFHTRQLGGVSVNAPLPRTEQRKKVRDEDDFMVPVFVNSETGQQHNKTKNGFDGENLTPLTPTYPGRQIEHQNVCDKDRSWSGSSGVNLKKEVRNQNEESSKVCSSREPSVKTAADLSTREKIDGHVEEANVSPDEDCGEHPTSVLSRSHENDACSPQEFRAGREPADNGCIGGADLMRDIGEESLPRKRSMSYLEGNHSVPDETNNDSECRGDKAFGSLQWANGDKSDDVSKTSMVDSISGLDISPDDVVGIIGQKHFWKVRRTIVNRERAILICARQHPRQRNSYYFLSAHLHLGFITVSVWCCFLYLLILRIVASMALEGLEQENKQRILYPRPMLGGSQRR